MDTVSPWTLLHICLVCVVAVPTKEWNTEFLAYVERYWQWRLEQSPEFATKARVNIHQDKLQQLTEEAFLQDKDQAQLLLDKAADLDNAALTRDERVVLRVVKENLATFIGGYEYRRYTQFNPVTPLEHPILDWKRWLSMAFLTNSTDYQNLASRYRALPVQVDQIIVLMRKAIAANTTQHETVLTGIDQQLSDLLEEITNKSSIFHKPYYDMPEAISSSDREELKTDGHQVIQQLIRPAIQKFRNFLSQEYRPETRKEAGISSLPGGDEVYQQCLKWHLGVPLTATEVHQMGQAEVNRIYTQMNNLKQQSGFSGSMDAYIADIKSQQEQYFKTEAEMLNGYRNIIARAQNQLHKVLLDVPDDCPVEVVQNMNPQSWARYSGPSKDGSSPGKFLINVFNPDTRPKFPMTALALHETVPGHHSMSCAKLAQNSPVEDHLKIEFRKYYAVPFNFPFFTSVSEGWALYAESLGEEMGIYTEPHSLLGRYTLELFRAARLVVDTGIHALGWSREEAISYLSNYTTRSSGDIENEINRYISWPGQACSYKIGELKIKELRMLAARRLGANFDLRAFNQEVLNSGDMPLSIMAEQVYEWIDEQAAAAISASNGIATSFTFIIISTVLCLFKLVL